MGDEIDEIFGRLRHTLAQIQPELPATYSALADQVDRTENEIRRLFGAEQ